MIQRNGLIHIADWILKKVYDNDLFDEIHGDLWELYNDRLLSMSKTKASWLYLWDAVLSVRNIGLKRKKKVVMHYNRIDILLSNIRFSSRLFMKDKFFSALNAIGLALGISVAVLLMMILQYDLKYDQHFSNHDRIYRIGSKVNFPGAEIRVATIANPLAEVLAYELPEIEAVTRLNHLGNGSETLITMDKSGSDELQYDPAVVRTDSNYFKVFNHDFIQGDAKVCFKEANSAVITQSTAKRLFGNVDPIGKILRIDALGNLACPVTGVIKDLPGNTHLKFNVLISGMESASSFRPGIDSVDSRSFWAASVYLYVLVRADYNPSEFYSKWPGIYNKYYKAAGDQMNHSTYDAILQPLDDIHFHSDLSQDEPIGSFTYLYALVGVGGLLILLACINYMNLSTAKSAKRSTEIAMKKAMGSGKRTLILSILTESILLALLSLIIAIILVIGILKTTSFNDLLGRSLSLELLQQPQFIATLLLTTLCIGIISGIYPAFYIPSIPTISALKGVYKSGRSGITFRKVLITTQFTISMLVVIAAIFVREQISFMRNQDTGFNKENILILPIRDNKDLQNQLSSFKTELLQNSHIHHVATSQSLVGLANSITSMMTNVEGEKGMELKAFQYMEVSEDYFETMGIGFLKGRDFQSGDKADFGNNFICNEAAVKLMGWGSNAVGKTIHVAGSTEPEGQIIGVVKDFNISSLHHSIEPLLIKKDKSGRGYLHLSIAGNTIPATLDYVKKQWTAHTSAPFDFFFLDQQFDQQYKSDEIQYQLLTLLSYLCIVISLLGLLGLSAFTTAQRTKEIGIRKIMGASVTKIIFLLSGNTLWLVILSSAIVTPLSYWIISKWLEAFAYRVPINYMMYVIVTLIALGFVFLTIALQSFRTAQSNPIDSLKQE